MCPVGLVHAFFSVIWEDDILPKLKIAGYVLLFLATPVILVFGGSAAFIAFDYCFKYLMKTFFGW